MSRATGSSRLSASNVSTGASFASIPDAFGAVVAQHPDRLAYEDRDRSVTYEEFDEESNAVANTLLTLDDARPLVVVAPLSIDTLAVVFGALKAGRLVAPLDPRWPVEQWLEVVRRLGGRLVVPDVATHSALPPAAAPHALVAPDLRGLDRSAPDVELDPDEPALVFFTSGSTGAPKGTLVGHGMPLRALDMFERVGPGDRVALLAPLSFITGAVTATSVICTGGSGHFFDATVEDLTKLPDWLDTKQITLLGLTVSLVALLAQAINAEGRTIESLRYVALGGEASTADDFAQAARAFPNAELRHIYGMTETGGVADHVVDPADMAGDGPVPVGRPWPWVRVDVVDDDGHPVAEGEDGEIWATGDHVAFGYWDEPALTTERFATNADGTRTVRTGDRGRVRPDGMLEVTGRNDRRVKVHGQLVDLSEVERELEQLAGVRDAVASSVPTEEGGHRVIAHVALDADAPITVGALRRGLADRLPPYAIPRAFFRVEDVPQTVNGKADRVWLRESAIGALPLETEYVAPRDGRERQVAQLFSEVLAVDHVGVHDDFFELGGDSLAAVDLIAGLSEELGLEIAVSDLLRHATVEAVAANVGGGRASSGQVVVPVNGGTGPALFCIPGAAASPVQFRPLARRLLDTALYAFAYRGLERRGVPDQTIAAIARRNVAAMRAVDPQGPYRLLGYSFGGVVALSMAHQLLDAGARVELLALVEPSLVPGDQSRATRARMYAARVQQRSLDAFPGDGVDASAARALRVIRAGARRTRHHLRLASAGVVERSGLAQHDVFFDLQTRMLRLHRPRPFLGSAVVFATQHYLDLVGSELDRVVPSATHGGRRRDVRLPGAHLDHLREPNVGEVARVLDGLLVPTGP